MSAQDDLDPLLVLRELMAVRQMREDISRRKQRRENSRFRNPEGARAIVAEYQVLKVRESRAWNAARIALARAMP